MSERYQIHERIGQGGRGSVYRAVDTQLKRDVAVKRIAVPDDASPDEIARIGERLMREATAMSALNHPNIVTIYDVQRDEEGGFVVMELINGDTLHDVVKRNPLTLEDFREVAKQTLEALIAANEANMLHRDIKPGNIMLMWLPTLKFQVKVLDFGLAKISEQPSLQTVDHGKSIVGSIHFMAPEQFELRELTAATDLYALGCVFYFCLTGKYPFDGDSMAKIMTAHLAGTYEPLDRLRPDLPGDLCQWVMWLMNRDMEHRPRSAREALDRMPLAESPTGRVYVVAPIQPIPASSPRPAAPATGPTPKLHTGRVPPLQPAKAVPVSKNTGRVPAVTGRVSTVTGRVPLSTGRVPLATGRVPLSSPPSAQTGRVRVPAPTDAARPVAAIASAPEPASRRPPWLAVALGIAVAGIVVALFAFAASRPKTVAEPYLVRDDFSARSGALKDQSPAVLDPALEGRNWTSSSGLHLTPAGLTSKPGFQTVALDVSGAFSRSDTVRIVARGVVNPTNGWLAVGFAPRPSGLKADDLLAWVNIHGDKNTGSSLGQVHQLGYRAKNLTVPPGGWKSGGPNDFELVLNCRRGEAVFYLNGQKKCSGVIFQGGMAGVPSHVVLAFNNLANASVREIAFENLGSAEIGDVAPRTAAPAQDKL
jgi:serine/threonine protein kinase